MLYPDPKVSAWLRDHVVLYWSSERPVPQVSIDFGDGRLLRTTLGGNSVHLVLAADGSPVDALPGLYAPAAFLARLQDAARCADDYASGSAERGMKVLANYHHQALLAEGKVLAGFGINSPPVLDEEGEWTAAAAQALTTRKSLVELPVLRAVGMVPTGATTGDPSALPPFPITMLAMLTAGMPRLGELSPESRGIIVWHLQSSGALPSGSPTLEEQAIAHVQVDLAQDTIIDEYALHAAIHRHRLGHPGEGMEALTAWIYRRVFRTPASDPWLGMRPAAWDGLEHREVVAERAPR